MALEGLPALEWIERCATQLTLADAAIGEVESLDLAVDLYQFPRTAAMAPEAAVSFAAQEMARPDPCFDRRRHPR